MLKRYWFRFEALPYPNPFNLGCGVTAYDHDDAISLVMEGFGSLEIPEILECISDVDVSTLDHRHVLPNIGNLSIRGMWFPQN